MIKQVQPCGSYVSTRNGIRIGILTTLPALFCNRGHSEKEAPLEPDSTGRCTCLPSSRVISENFMRVPPGVEGKANPGVEVPKAPAPPAPAPKPKPKPKPLSPRRGQIHNSSHHCKRLRAPPRQPGRPQDRKGGKRVSQKKGRKGRGKGEGGGGRREEGGGGEGGGGEGGLFQTLLGRKPRRIVTCQGLGLRASPSQFPPLVSECRCFCKEPGKGAGGLSHEPGAGAPIPHFCATFCATFFATLWLVLRGSSSRGPEGRGEDPFPEVLRGAHRPAARRRPVDGI